MTSNYLIAYDIPSPKRLGRIYRYLKNEAMPIQYSVFWGVWTRPQALRIKGRLEELIKPEQDDVRIYSLPSIPKVTVLGRGKALPEGVQVHFYKSSSTWLIKRKEEGLEVSGTEEENEGERKKRRPD